MQKHGVATRLPRLTWETLRRDWIGIVRALLGNWLWLAGILVGFTGAVMFAVALAIGELTIVQPLVNLNMLVAMAIGVFILGERLARGEWVGGLLMIIGAAVLGLSLGGVEAIVQTRTGVAAGVRGLSAVGIASVLLVMSLARLIPSFRKELAYALAGGLSFGLGNMLLKTASLSLSEAAPGIVAGAMALILDWATWGVVAGNAVGFVLFQMAFSHGRVSVVNPLNTISSSLLPVAAGFAVYGERSDLLRVLGIVVVLAGTAVLMMARPAAEVPRGVVAAALPVSATAGQTPGD
jgi:uncharacterized membrane protein